MLLYASAALLGAVGAGYLGVKFFCPWLLADIRYIAKAVPLVNKLEAFMKRGFFLIDIFEEQVVKQPNKIFLKFRDDKYTYMRRRNASEGLNDEVVFQEVNEKANQLARAALKMGLKKGDTVAMVMHNEAAFIWTYLGMLKIGVVMSMINTNLRGKQLQHSVQVSSTNIVIVGADVDLQSAVVALLPEFPDLVVYTTRILVVGRPACLSTALHDTALTMPTENTDVAIRADTKATDPAVYIFTSGTTGLPKAALCSHKKSMASMILGGLFGMVGSDTMFTCLPLYHSNALLVSCTCTVVFGATLALETKFSKTRFLDTCRKHDVTVVTYIGELARYLLTNEKSDKDKQHSIRLMLGGGLRSDIWEEFQTRFSIAKIGEYYASTEGSTALVNYDGITGVCGRITPLLMLSRQVSRCVISLMTPRGRLRVGGYLHGCTPELNPLHVSQCYGGTMVTLGKSCQLGLYKWDIKNECLVRDAKGRCVEVPLGSPGLLLTAINKKQPFDGYKGKRDLTESQIVRNVLKDGDAYYNTGDLMVQDRSYNVYFSDRLGDTFRWKGENVSTTEVSNVLTELDFVSDVSVYGVTIPGHDGRAGMAALLVAQGHQMSAASLAEFRKHCLASLPSYASPLFLRIRTSGELDITATLKQTKVALKKEAFNVTVIEEDVYYLDRKTNGYLKLTDSAFKDIEDGKVVF